MIEVRELGADDGPLKRELRLAALLDAPAAFSASYAEAAGRTDAQWRTWPDGSGLFAAFVDGRPVGLAGAGAFHGPEVAYLFTMWVAPPVRGTGVAQALLDAVRGWALAHGRDEILLEVTAGNDRAARCYARYGFRPSDDPLDTVDGQSMRLRVVQASTVDS